MKLGWNLKLKMAFLYQTATFRPKGVAGRLYWYLVTPLHWFVFNGMINKIIKHIIVEKTTFACKNMRQLVTNPLHWRKKWEKKLGTM